MRTNKMKKKAGNILDMFLPVRVHDFVRDCNSYIAELLDEIESQTNTKNQLSEELSHAKDLITVLFNELRKWESEDEVREMENTLSSVFSMLPKESEVCDDI